MEPIKICIYSVVTQEIIALRIWKLNPNGYRWYKNNYVMFSYIFAIEDAR